MAWEAQTQCLLPLWGSLLLPLGLGLGSGTSIKVPLSCSQSGRFWKGHLRHLNTNIPFRAIFLLNGWNSPQCHAKRNFLLYLVNFWDMIKNNGNRWPHLSLISFSTDLWCLKFPFDRLKHTSQGQQTKGPINWNQDLEEVSICPCLLKHYHTRRHRSNLNAHGQMYKQWNIIQF